MWGLDPAMPRIAKLLLWFALLVLAAGAAYFACVALGMLSLFELLRHIHVWIAIS